MMLLQNLSRFHDAFADWHCDVFSGLVTKLQGQYEPNGTKPAFVCDVSAQIPTLLRFVCICSDLFRLV